MVFEIFVNGYEELINEVSKYKNQKIYILFKGNKGPDGLSWCADCNVAEPVIKSSLSQAPENSFFIHCFVGSREEWKNPKNDFRSKLGIRVVPTLINWNEKEKKLEELQLTNPNVISLMFED